MDGAREVIRVLRGGGFEAFLVGGCVRDLLLGTAPKDHDIATAARPEEVMRLFARTVPTGIEHGTVTVLIGRLPYEVTSYRRDVECDGRRAKVEPAASLEEDLARRDFTVNAMALDPETERVLDPFGGRADLTARLIRCVGAPLDRFDEDHLRLMRAIRFAAQLDFEIEPGTWSALEARSSFLERISRERVSDELWALLAARAAHRGVRLLQQSGMLPIVLPALAALQQVQQPSEWHHLDVFEHSLLALSHAEAGTADPVTRLAVLLHDIGKPATASVDERGRIHFYGHAETGARMVEELVAGHKLAASRRIPLDEKALTRRLQTLIRLHLRPFDLEEAGAPALRRFVREAGPLLDELLLVAACDRLAHRTPDLTPLERLRGRLAALGPLEAIQAIESPLSGGEIMALLGLPAGPAVGAAKAALVAAILDGELVTEPERAREWLRGWAAARAAKTG